MFCCQINVTSRHEVNSHEHTRVCVHVVDCLPYVLCMHTAILYTYLKQNKLMDYTIYEIM